MSSRVTWVLGVHLWRTNAPGMKSVPCRRKLGTPQEYQGRAGAVHLNPALRRLTQEVWEFETNLDCTASIRAGVSGDSVLIGADIVEGPGERPSVAQEWQQPALHEFLNINEPKLYERARNYCKRQIACWRLQLGSTSSELDSGAGAGAGTEPEPTGGLREASV